MLEKKHEKFFKAKVEMRIKKQDKNWEVLRLNKNGFIKKQPFICQPFGVVCLN